MKTIPLDSLAGDGAASFYPLYPAGHLYFLSFFRIGDYHGRYSGAGTCYLHWYVSSLPPVGRSLLLYQPLPLGSNVVGVLDRHHQSSNNGSLLDYNNSATSFKQTSNASRGDGVRNDAFRLGHRASIYLD